MNFLKHHKQTDFISAIDRFQYEFDDTHPKVDSQQAEIEKFQRVFALRDGTTPDNADERAVAS